MPDGGIPLEQQVQMLEERAPPRPTIRRPRRTGQHHDARIQQRPDDDHQLRQARPPPQRRRHARQSLHENPRSRRCGPRRSPTASSASPAIAAPIARHRSRQARRGVARAPRARDAQVPRPRRVHSRTRAARLRLRQPDSAGALESAHQRPPGHAARRPDSDSRRARCSRRHRRPHHPRHRLGIPADKLPHIFDRFYTTKSGPDASGKGGMGVGLSTCREIIDQHQGRIRVESTVGVGTAFTFKLPAAKLEQHSPHLALPLPKLGMPIGSTATFGPAIDGNRASMRSRYRPGTSSSRVFFFRCRSVR